MAQLSLLDAIQAAGREKGVEKIQGYPASFFYPEPTLDLCGCCKNLAAAVWRKRNGVPQPKKRW